MEMRDRRIKRLIKEGDLVRGFNALIPFLLKPSSEGGTGANLLPKWLRVNVQIALHSRWGIQGSFLLSFLPPTPPLFSPPLHTEPVN